MISKRPIGYWCDEIPIYNELNLQSNLVLHVKAKKFCFFSPIVSRNIIAMRLEGWFVSLGIIVHQFRKAHNQCKAEPAFEWPLQPTCIDLTLKNYIYNSVGRL